MTGKSFSEPCHHKYAFYGAYPESEFWWATYVFYCVRCNDTRTISQSRFWTGEFNA